MKNKDLEQVGNQLNILNIPNHSGFTDNGDYIIYVSKNGDCITVDADNALVISKGNYKEGEIKYFKTAHEYLSKILRRYYEY